MECAHNPVDVSDKGTRPLVLVGNGTKLSHLAVAAAIHPRARLQCCWLKANEVPELVSGCLVLLLHPPPAWETRATDLLEHNEVWRYFGEMPYVTGVQECGEDVFHCLEFAMRVPMLECHNVLRKWAYLQLSVPDCLGDVLFCHLQSEFKGKSAAAAMAELQRLWLAPQSHVDDIMGSPEVLLIHNRFQACWDNARRVLLCTKYGNVYVAYASTHVPDHHHVMLLRALQKEEKPAFTLVVTPSITETGDHGPALIDWRAPFATDAQLAAWCTEQREPAGARRGSFSVPDDRKLLQSLFPSLLSRIWSKLTQ